MVDESRAGLDVRGVMLVGSVELVEGPEALKPHVRDYLHTDDITIRLTPTDVITWDLASTSGGIELTRRGLALPLDA